MARTDDPRPRISQLLVQGVSFEAIVARLSLEGWDPKDVAAVLNGTPAASSAPVAVVAPSLPRQATPIAPRRGKWRFLLTTGVVVLSLTVGFAGYTFKKPPVMYSLSIPAATASTTAPELIYGALPELQNPDYYRNVKKNLIAQGGSFVDANLSDMKLEVYVQGVLQFEVPILAKGRPGSWWETPAGIYQIQSREENHFSSFGNVYQPWSLAFQGNFFIHGWPYYEDGTPVAVSYSGGCIRLASEDAEKVFALASVGMPVIVYNAEPSGDEFGYQLNPPLISAHQYLVADVKNGTVLTGKGVMDPTPIASITKLVTALIATEYINLDKDINVPKESLVYTSIPRLKQGQNARAYDLLFLLLQESSNEAAEVLAMSKGRSQFVGYMNEKARAIGLHYTLFTDPSGAKSDLSTPEDLFTLLKYIYNNRRFVLDITAGTTKASAYGTPAFKNIKNFNLVKGAPATLLGGKIGQTSEAGETYAGIFSIKIGAEERLIAVIVLTSQNAEADVQKLLTFVHNSYAPESL